MGFMESNSFLPASNFSRQLFNGLLVAAPLVATQIHPEPAGLFVEGFATRLSQ